MLFGDGHMTIVYEVSENVKERMIKFYYDKKRSKTPPYAIFQADDADTNITLYTSNKVVFQGKNADIDARIWFDLEMSLNNRDVEAEIAKTKTKEKEKVKPDARFANASTIGSDEVGTGDYFGPIVVTASYVDKDQIKEIMNLGVRDSKKLSDDKIIKIAPQLIKLVPHTTFILDNKTYNDKFTNMNMIKAILHNKVLTQMVKKYPDAEYVVVDQFCMPKNYYEYIENVKEKCTDITFTTKGEDKCLSVAVSSVISRYVFLSEMRKIEEKYEIFIKKGAGADVDNQAAMLVQRYGFDVLHDIAKLNFKNTDKIKAIIDAQK